ncbi:hypothetical protein PIB30_070535 [Stylosanthes scabra]|uniref:Uncharacterized protein n=1 Tax=Stylosanthes scabra TaxID=79078 RepID=A0ABU6TN95_9FABA|nr:hypothetical protein [Stylosanthes scabra]
MAKEVSGHEVVVRCNERPNTVPRLGYFARNKRENRRAKRSVVRSESSEARSQRQQMEESNLKGLKNQCAILIGNVDKDLGPLTVVNFLHKHTKMSPRVFIFPSFSWELYTKAAIVLDSKKDFRKLCEFLDNDNHIITSSIGRPWVIMEKLAGQKEIKASLGTLLPVSKSKNQNCLTNNHLKVVPSGSQEFKIAADLRELFLEFINHQKQLYRKLALEEGKV